VKRLRICFLLLCLLALVAMVIKPVGKPTWISHAEGMARIAWSHSDWTVQRRISFFLTRVKARIYRTWRR
jgi:hypothetical protein